MVTTSALAVCTRDFATAAADDEAARVRLIRWKDSVIFKDELVQSVTRREGVEAGGRSGTRRVDETCMAALCDL